MRRRTRSIAGLLALAAMTIAFAEAVAAATCAPGMMAGMESADVSAVSASDALMAGTVHGDGHEGEAHHDGGEEPHCPFGPVAAQSCATAASIPATGQSAPAGAIEVAAPVFIDAAQRDLLLATTLFHPPRA